MNDTINKFGYPETVIKEYSSWIVLFRMKQVTLGSLVCVAKEDVESLSSLSDHAFLELQKVHFDVEKVLKKNFNYDKINYLTLMMVDRHVHFHIIPRYKEYRVVSGLRIEDIFWPGPPDITRYIDMNKEFIDNLILLLKSEFIKYS